MTRPLRKLHRRIFYALALGLVWLFIAAIALRRPAPLTPRIPDALRAPAGQAGQRGAAR
jgi:hypothetical protein